MKKFFYGCAVFVLAVSFSGVCFAFGGRVSYPDGAPAAGATVKLIDSGDAGQTTTCDAGGRFQFAEPAEGDARILITAPDGQNYAPVVLPATVFGSSETAIVLQQK